MAENSREDPDQLTESDNRMHRWLELAVPLFSFGGILIAFLLPGPGIHHEFPYRCSRVYTLLPLSLPILPGYVQKRTSSRSQPRLYAVILFVLPSDLIPDLILPILYAISLTILLVRLKYRFGKPGTAVSMGKELGGSLKTYIDQTREPLKNTSPDTAHNATLAFVQFAQGDYAKVARISETLTGTDDNYGHVISACPVHSLS